MRECACAGKRIILQPLTLNAIIMIFAYTFVFCIVLKLDSVHAGCTLDEKVSTTVQETHTIY